SKYRRRRHGSSTKDIPAERFVVFAQNHDQIGNRMLGERLTQLVSFEELKLAAGAVILSPFIPLLFMGEEYGEEAPFQYFISHGDAGLVAAVRDGRRREFAGFGWNTEPPDPQDESTFLRAKLNHQLKSDGKFHTLWEFYRELIRLRKRLSPLAELSKEQCDVLGFERERVLLLRRWYADDAVMTIFNFNDEPVSLALSVAPGRWLKGLDSADQHWQGAGSVLPAELGSGQSAELHLQAKSMALFIRDRDHQSRLSETDLAIKDPSV
ncbi:MAG: DUF3459 domain-containing protein, partial [Candidatus Binatia bacterium]